MRGITYFLIVGIENYNDSKFSKVSYATKDALQIKQSFLDLGYPETDIVYLDNNAPTKTTIESNLELIVKKTLPQDRIIFFFAGHGLSFGGNNMLVPVDANSALLEKTSISIKHILGVLKTAKSKRNILFLDCCHSGFEPGELERAGISAFDNDRLLMEYRDEEYCLGFASCQSHQISVSDHKLQHGVWSHFLIQALKGNAPRIYEEGCLFSSSLQEYLRDNTSEFVRLNSTPKRDQTPVQFGHLTKGFIVEDLSSLLASIAAAKISKSLSVESISFNQEDLYPIKSHPNFIKGKHFIPSETKGVHNSFIKKISESIIESDVETMSPKIKNAFGYTLKQMKIEKNPGYAAIITPDFDYEIEISQSKYDPAEYSIARFASEFKDMSVLESNEFNKVFANTFSNLAFHLNNPVDIESLIENIESLPKGSLLTVDYNHNDLSRCVIKVKGLENSIVAEMDTLFITSDYRSTPQELIDSFKEASRVLLSRDIGILIE